MTDKLIIDIARLKDEGEDFAGELNGAILEMTGELLYSAGPVRYELHAKLFGRELLVRGHLAADFGALCSRCGASFTFTTREDDFTVSVETDEKCEFADLTDEVRESILLSLPTYPLCREECLGVCSTCGKNLNEGPCNCSEQMSDERWSALGAVLTDNSKQEQVEKKEK